MIKRTLMFENPAYLSLKNRQLYIERPDQPAATVPVEDIGIVLLDNRQITITHALLDALTEHNAAVITCNSRHLPAGLLLPLEGHTEQSERYQAQVSASLPLRKQLWQQTIQAKITNQAAVLMECCHLPAKNMAKWANDVRSGDPTNLEARAAVYYWDNLFPDINKFTRERFLDTKRSDRKEAAPCASSIDEQILNSGDQVEMPDSIPQEEVPTPNTLLNYGYAVLRAVIARALTGSGLLPTLGIHHRSRYNAYCLADDIMEPYRPYVDRLVVEIWRTSEHKALLNTQTKAQLLTIPTLDVEIDGRTSPLMIAATLTTASLARCFLGESRRLAYPTIASCIK